MASEKILAGKAEVVAMIAEKMKNSASFVFVDYKGINVEQVTALRNKAREMGVEYKIYKNTMLRLAANELGYTELADILTGSTAVAFSSDVIAPAKLFSEFVKDNRLNTLAFKGGVIDGKVTDVESITKIAELPAKEVLIAQVIGSLNAPITKFALVLKAIVEKDEQTA